VHPFSRAFVAEQAVFSEERFGSFWKWTVIWAIGGVRRTSGEGCCKKESKKEKLVAHKNGVLCSKVTTEWL
jgi:hypothetical protein